jgi:hypothetical protein
MFLEIGTRLKLVTALLAHPRMELRANGWKSLQDCIGGQQFQIQATIDQSESWRDGPISPQFMILLANSIWVLTNDRMAHLGFKSQANSSNPLKRVKFLNDRHCRHFAIFQPALAGFSY